MGYFHCLLDPVKGSEQAGRRPVLVISREQINQLLPVVNVIPLTSRKAGRKVYANEVLLLANETGLPQDSIALCYQVRTLDKSRLGDLLAQIEDANLRTQIKDSLRFQLEI